MQLPESLTTYRIMAVASDKLSRFGSGESEIRINKPITMKPAFPRFMAVGDTALFGSVVTSQLREAGTALVTMRSLDPGVLEIRGTGRQTVEIAANGSIEVRFDALARSIDAADICEQRRHLLASAQQIADRPGNFRRRQRRGRDLVEQRLEQMMVAAIDQRDPDRRTGEAKGGLQPAETGADDHHMMGLFRRCRHGMQPRF